MDVLGELIKVLKGIASYCKKVMFLVEHYANLGGSKSYHGGDGW